MSDDKDSSPEEAAGQTPYVPKRPQLRKNVEDGEKSVPEEETSRFGFFEEVKKNDEASPSPADVADGNPQDKPVGEETQSGDAPENENFWDKVKPEEEVAHANDTKAHKLADTLESKKPKNNPTKPTRPPVKNSTGENVDASSPENATPPHRQNQTGKPGGGTPPGKNNSASGKTVPDRKAGEKNVSGRSTGKGAAGGAKNVAASGESAAGTAKQVGGEAGGVVAEGAKNAAGSANTAKAVGTNALRAAGDAKNIKDNLQEGDVSGSAKAAANTGIRIAGLTADALGASGAGSTIANKVAPIVTKHGKKLAIIPIVGVPLTIGASFMVFILLVSSIIALLSAILGGAGASSMCPTESGKAGGNNGGVTPVIDDVQARETAKYVWDQLVKNGYSEIAAAGIVGNMQQESNYDPTAVNPSSDVKGLVQWSFGTRGTGGRGINGNRFEPLAAWATANGYDPETVKGQTAMVIYEVRNATTYNGLTQANFPSVKLFEQMNAASTPEQSSDIWIKVFEGAAGQEDEQRAAYARSVYEQFKGSAPTTAMISPVRLFNIDLKILPTGNIMPQLPIMGVLPIYTPTVAGAETTPAPASAGAAGRYWPLPPSTPISSPFGMRTVNGVTAFHDGVDFDYPANLPVTAATKGKVTNHIDVNEGGYGLYVQIDSPDGVMTQYGHVNEINLVPDGTVVEPGTVIAKSGDTFGNGSAVEHEPTGWSHLHFRVHVNGEKVDPAGWLNGASVTSSSQKAANPKESCDSKSSPSAQNVGFVPVAPGGWGPPIRQYQTTDTFGTRGGKHMGMDLAGPAGTPLYAARGGVVVSTYTECGVGSMSDYCGKPPFGGYGNHVYIDHGDGYKTLYAHMQNVQVSVGDTVEAGQQIGSEGTSGNSSGPHLHFEVHLNGVQIDPTRVIDIPYSMGY